MHRDTRAVLDSRNNVYRSTMELCDAKDESQAQSGSIRTATHLRSSEESVKCPAPAVLREPGAVIANGDGHSIMNMRDIDDHPGSREAQRIVEQISQGNRERILVARHDRVVRRSHDANATPISGGREFIGNHLHELANVDIAVSNRYTGKCIQPCQREDRVDHASSTIRGRDQFLQRPIRFTGILRPAGNLRMQAHSGERVSQLMRGVSGQRTLVQE